MGLLSKALVFAAGYAVGHPEGRRRLQELTKQAKRNPKVKQAKERAWDAAGDQALAVKNRIAKRTDTENAQPQPHPRPVDAGAGVHAASPPAPAVKPEDGPTVPAPTGAAPTSTATTGITPSEATPIVPPSTRS